MPLPATKKTNCSESSYASGNSVVSMIQKALQLNASAEHTATFGRKMVSSVIAAG